MTVCVCLFLVSCFFFSVAFAVSKLDLYFRQIETAPMPVPPRQLIMTAPPVQFSHHEVAFLHCRVL
jgi:hypothetical protein